MTADAVTPTVPHVPVQIEWTGGLQFDAGRIDSAKVRIDGDTKNRSQSVRYAAGSRRNLCRHGRCAHHGEATHSAEIAQRAGRGPASRRHPETACGAVLHFTLQGAGITPEKAERAVELSVTKYCSVGSSLRPDAPLTWVIDIKT